MKLNREEIHILHIVVKSNIKVLQDMVDMNTYVALDQQKAAKRQLKVLNSIKKKMEKEPLPVVQSGLK